MSQEWKNYGDENFITYGGNLVKADEYPNCFHVLVLNTEIFDYAGDYEEPVIVAMCYIDVSDWLDDDKRKSVNSFVGNSKDFIPNTMEEQMSYCVDLISYYGLHEFSPVFPEVTGCGPYALGTIDKWIVSKEIARNFMKEQGIPEDYRE